MALNCSLSPRLPLAQRGDALPYGKKRKTAVSSFLLEYLDINNDKDHKGSDSRQDP